MNLRKMIDQYLADDPAAVHQMSKFIGNKFSEQEAGGVQDLNAANRILIAEEIGLTPHIRFRKLVNELLNYETASQGRHGSKINNLKYLCTQIFYFGEPADVMKIWAAKNATFDTTCAIDVFYMCGAGVEQTMAFLENSDLRAAREALDYLRECVDSGEFENFQREAFHSSCQSFFGEV